jgi:hypothetical protein
LDPFQNDAKVFKSRNKYGYKDLNGKILIQPVYDEVNEFQYNLASVRLNNKVALVNKKGEIVIPFGKYDIIYYYREGMLQVRKDGKFGFLNMKGQEIIPCRFEEADYFRNGMAEVKKGDKQGVINKSGEEIIPIIYEKIVQFYEYNLIKIKINGKWGYINYDRKLFINPEFEELDQPWNDMIMAKKDGKYGYFDHNGVLVIACKYEKANPFTESGRAFIILNGKAGVVFKNGEEKFPEKSPKQIKMKQE